jgi:hypothetical protein
MVCQIAAGGLAAGAVLAYRPCMSGDSRPAVRRTLIETLFTVFMRMTAVACFYFGLRYWDLVLGISTGGVIRFDVMNLPWRTMTTALAVAYPIIALGLWMGSAWGAVLWAAVAIGEVLAHTLWVYIYGPDDLLIVMDVSVACLYVAFRIGLYLERRGRRRVRTDSL